MSQSMNDTTLCHDTTYNVIQSLCIVYIWFFSRFWCLILTYSDGSLDGESISFSLRSTILVIDLLRVWLPLFESATRNVTAHHHFCRHQHQLFWLMATGYVDSLVISISRCNQIQNYSFYHSIFLWFLNFAEILFSICAKTHLQYSARVSIFF